MNSLNKEPKLNIKIGDLEFKNPVFVSSGTFGYGKEYGEILDIDKLGALITKTLTPKPKGGNRQPRIVETPCGLLNAIGLQNKGIDHFIKTILPELKKIKTKLIVSIGSSRTEDFKNLVRCLEEKEEIDALEINLSCPNIIYELSTGLEDSSKSLISQDAYLSFEVVRAVRKMTRKPIIPKLSPNVTDIVAIARSCYDAGADAITLANTYLGMAIDINKRKPLLDNITGGLSGPAIKPLTLRLAWEVSQEINLPVIANGGIMNYKDALEYIITGATAVACGTGLFVDPKSPESILKGIKQYLIENNISSVTELTGSIRL